MSVYFEILTRARPTGRRERSCSHILLPGISILLDKLCVMSFVLPFFCRQMRPNIDLKKFSNAQDLTNAQLKIFCIVLYFKIQKKTASSFFFKHKCLSFIYLNSLNTATRNNILRIRQKSLFHPRSFLPVHAVITNF